MCRIIFNDQFISIPHSVYANIIIDMFTDFTREETPSYEIAMDAYLRTYSEMNKENERLHHEFMSMKWWKRLYTGYPKMVELPMEYQSSGSDFNLKRARYNAIYAGLSAMMIARRDGLETFVYPKDQDPDNHFENYVLKYLPF